MKKLAFMACAVGLVFAMMAAQGFCEEDDLAIGIQVSPHVIVVASNGTWVTVHADISYGSVATETVALNGISADLCFADDRGDLVAKFNIAAIKGIAALPEVTLTLTGVTKDGVAFSGSETVKVVTGKK